MKIMNTITVRILMVLAMSLGFHAYVAHALHPELRHPDLYRA